MKVELIAWAEGEAVAFTCPGCGDNHTMPIKPQPKGASWEFNGDLNNPTLAPSILVRSGHYCNQDEKPGNCYCDFTERFPDQPPMKWNCYRCHSYVRNGRIEFLSDCTHALAGKTVDLPETEQ